MSRTYIQCLLFVLDGRSESFVLIPSTAVETHPNVCQLFTRNNITILNNNEEYPVLQEAVECDQVEALELIALGEQRISYDPDGWSTINHSSYKDNTFPSGTTPFVPITVEVGNAQLVSQLLSKDAALFYHLHQVYTGKRYFNCTVSTSYYDEFMSIDDENLETIERLLADKMNMRLKNSDGETILHLAVKRRNENLVSLLLERNIDVDKVSNDGSTALHFAVEDTYDGWPFIVPLLEKGASVNARRKDGSTSLLIATSTGTDSAVKLLVQYGADVNIGDENGWTPLHEAALERNLSLVHKFLDHHANVNALATFRHAKGVTPLAIAVQRGHTHVIKCLLKKGADLNIRCYDNRTILKLALCLQRVDVIKCLIRNPNLYDIIYKEVLSNKAVLREGKVYAEIAKLLLEHGFIVDTVDRSDSELLYTAIFNSDYITTKRLLESGANVNAVYQYIDIDHRDDSKYVRNTMPLFTAIEYKANDIVRLLINHGADVNAKRLNLGFREIKTPLYEALETENLEAAILLAESVELSFHECDIIYSAIVRDRPELLEEALRKGANVNGNGAGTAVNKRKLPLLIAARYGATKTIEILIEFGASVASRNINGNTALHVIRNNFTSHNFEKVKCLVQRLADVDARNFEGRTPIFNLIKKDNLDCMIGLLKYGASISVTDTAGFSPIDFAVYSKNMGAFLAIFQFYFTDTEFIQKTNIYQFFNVLFIESLGDFTVDPTHHFFFHMFVHERRTLEEFATSLAWHMIKLKAAFSCQGVVFDFCSEENLRSVSKGEYLLPADRWVWLDFQTKCETEISQMKTHYIGDSCATYYDILTKSEQEVSRYLQNADIHETFQYDDYKTKFPVYAEILSYQLQKGMLRRRLLDESIKQCHLLVGVFEDLPLHLKEKVLGYLSNREMEVAVYACQCILNRQ